MKSDKIKSAVLGVTGKFAKQRKAEERHASARYRRYEAMTCYRKITLKDAARAILRDAYQKASANGTLPAHARQIMYAARPYIQEKTGKSLNDAYFTQTLLPDYMEAHRGDCAGWNVVFDARGHFHEPHTKQEVPLGTIDIRGYLHGVRNHRIEQPSFSIREPRYPTCGPRHRYGAILFIEKEGFMPLFEAVQLAQRYDIAIMSTKGMSVTASRELVDELCAGHNIPLLVVHDFDKAGFSIVGTLKRDTRRYNFNNKIEVTDLGLRLGDIEGLQSEGANIEPKARQAARRNLKENGATPEEIEFLLDQRVELNAFTSDALIAWIEAKLAEHGIEKVIPDDATLASAYERAAKQHAIQLEINEIMDSWEPQSINVPADLRSEIMKRLDEDKSITWDMAIKDILDRSTA